MAAVADGGGVSGQSADLKAPPVVRKRPFTSPLSRHSRTLAGPHSTDLPNSPGFGLESQAQHQAGVAQLVEQRIRNAKVGSSTLFTGTKFQKATLAVAFCFSGAVSALPGPLPPVTQAHLPRMSGKGCGLPFLPRPRCSRARRNPEQHSPQLYNTCALLLGPESIARLEMGRCPSPVIRHPSSHYQINHNLIFATAIHSQHINHTLIFKPTPP